MNAPSPDRRCPASRPPPTTELLRASCGQRAVWSKLGGESSYCPKVSGGCDDPACRVFRSGDVLAKHVAETAATRLAALRSWLSQAKSTLPSGAARAQAGPAARVVLLVSVNAGFFYLFKNWACSADAAGVSVRERTLVITTASGAAQAAALGFRPLTFGSVGFGQVRDEASPAFGLWSHGTINAVSVLALSDLIRLGQDVLWFDADSAWRSDPVPWLTSPQPYARCSDVWRSGRGGPNASRVALRPNAWCSSSRAINETRRDVAPDLHVMDDVRWDSSGPANTGFVFARSNCRTRWLADALTDGLHVLINARSDQRFINRILASEYALHVTFALLPMRLFLNGPAWSRLGSRDWPGGRSGKVFPPPGWIAAHASWTASHADKQNRLQSVGAWCVPHSRQDRAVV